MLSSLRTDGQLNRLLPFSLGRGLLQRSENRPLLLVLSSAQSRHGTVLARIVSPFWRSLAYDRVRGVSAMNDHTLAISYLLYLLPRTLLSGRTMVIRHIHVDPCCSVNDDHKSAKGQPGRSASWARH
jgi:hypothetical protein